MVKTNVYYLLTKYALRRTKECVLCTEQCPLQVCTTVSIIRADISLDQLQSRLPCQKCFLLLRHQKWIWTIISNVLAEHSAETARSQVSAGRWRLLKVSYMQWRVSDSDFGHCTHKTGRRWSSRPGWSGSHCKLRPISKYWTICYQRTSWKQRNLRCDFNFSRYGGGSSLSCTNCTQWKWWLVVLPLIVELFTINRLRCFLLLASTRSHFCYICQRAVRKAKVLR